MKNYSSKELIKIAKSKGYYLDRVTGSHHIFKNQIGEEVNIPHPKKDLPIGTQRAILKQLGAI